MQAEAIADIIKGQFKFSNAELNVNDSPASLMIPGNVLKEVMLFLRDDNRLFFDQLSCLTGIDNGPENGTMEVIYNLYSIPFEHHFMLKVELEREKPQINTISDVWKTAEWHEREAFDLLGIEFKGHPDLRRILLPDDWEGHPLRKDYTLQKYYHGIKVEY